MEDLRAKQIDEDDLPSDFASYWVELDHQIDTFGSRIDFTSGTSDGDAFRAKSWMPDRLSSWIALC